ncbi:RagB/SusD family nutrient uptake outer membrane protein [Parapedobacter soli]|uniref:RagB/SusD family nutrient uptake outer membrane protein n=1 Tax=Parapedobacter soli TaxID=416955 RepID=UPI0021C954D7|nr:RagB/SusD family nutrient uptake outer membrane protein [Parapedobacter soli]
MKKILIGFTAILLLIQFPACNKSFLDVSDELAEELDMEKIFSNPQDARRFHRNIYEGIPNTMNMTWWSSLTTHRGQSNVWALLSDDLCKFATSFPYSRPLDPTDVIISRWDYYQYIRQANLFLEWAREIPRAGSGMADYLSASELHDLKAEARFFRAYYHYLLFEAYGPIPIMEVAVSPSETNLDFARNSVDEVVDFIYNELTAVAGELRDPNLANEELLAVPTKGTALAVRARLMVYAASPLFNGGYEEATGLANTDGKLLFPAYDAAKWERALAALQEFIDYANADHYELFKVYSDGQLDPYGSVYGVHMSYNKETIFARSQDNQPSASYFLDTKNPPRVVTGSTQGANTAVTQALVDAFFMVDGLSIDESPLYSEEGFSEAGDDLSGQTETGTYRMFINREPRFYQAVFYNGRKWHIGNEQAWFNRGGNSDMNSARYPLTGHLMYKRMSQRVYPGGNYPREEYRPPIVHRLAEFYLLYAEALNEVNPDDLRIIEYIDKIRERAGVPLLKDIKADIVGDREAQRQAIRAEMRVELCTEGQRYFDLKRWMIADKSPEEGGLDGPIYGMDMFAMTLEGFYTRTKVRDRVFDRKNYLMPIPLAEIQKSQLLVQNPGY